MKLQNVIINCFVMLSIFGVNGCSSTSYTEAPISQVEETPTVVQVTPRTTQPNETEENQQITVEPARTPTFLPQPFPTFNPDTSKERLSSLMESNGDCQLPCLWGIVPEQTRIGEARDIFNHLGLQMANSTFEGKNYAATNIDLDNDLSISVILTIQNDVVENLRIKINIEKQVEGIDREWMAYSPEILIKRYGTPSRVDFFADWGPGPFFAMQMYFDTVDLIVQYAGNDIIPSQKGPSLICPLTAPFESVWLWMGKDPVYPPGQGIPIEKATPMTMNEFSKLIIGDPNNACFLFNGDVFP